MAVDTLDINQIAVILSQLIQNYNELAQNWFDVFYNPEQMDVTLKFFDPDGNLQTYTLPNRAKDFRYIMNGVGDPEGQINAKVGTMFLDTQGGDIYLKRTGEGNTGWQRVMSMTEVYSNGKGSPEGVVTGKKGDMYVDLDSGMLYTKTTATGATGWSLAGAGGKADQTYVDRRFDEVDDNLAVLNAEINEGVVHKKGAPETITSDKTFNSNITITGTTNMSGATTISGATRISGTLNVTNQATFTKVINGTAYRALSADIAEYYSADEKLLPGTLVQFGGKNEITKAVTEVNAVVSSEPAYILNAEGQMEHPTLIALEGRIPVRVIGAVRKFDKITLSNTDGVATVDNTNELCYNIIGRALEDNPDEGEKLVECVVKLSL